EGVARADLVRRRLVGGRQALHRVGDAAGDQQKSIVARRRFSSRCNTARMERFIEKNPRVIAGERPPARVCAMHSGSKADDHESRVLHAEWRHRSTKITAVLRSNHVEEGCKARTAAAFGIVGGGRCCFWQNGGLAGKGTHGAAIVARGGPATAGTPG